MFQSLLSLLNAGFAGPALLLFLALAVVLAAACLFLAVSRLPAIIRVLASLTVAAVVSLTGVSTAAAQEAAYACYAPENPLAGLKEGYSVFVSDYSLRGSERSGRPQSGKIYVPPSVDNAAGHNGADAYLLYTTRCAPFGFDSCGRFITTMKIALADESETILNTRIYRRFKGMVHYFRGLERDLYHSNVPAEDSHERCPDAPMRELCHAARTGDADFAQRSLDIGAMVNADCPDTTGNKPLHMAARHGKSGVVDFLLINSARVNLHNRDGKTPFDLAKENGHNEVALKLQQSGARTGEDVVGAANQSELLQLRAELVSLRMEVESLRAEVNAICGATPDCAQAATQRARLAAAENQIGRKTSEVAALFPGGGGGGSGGGSGGGGGSGLAIGIGAAALLGIAFYALSPDGDPDAFTLQPSAFYENRNGSETLRYGMRLAYDQDPWRLWWSADDSRFGWGGEWRRDGLRAQAAVWETAETLYLNADLGMEWDWRGWAVRPSWRLRAGAGSSGEWSWDSGADLSAEWARAGWTIRPSVRAGDLRRPAEADFHLGLGRAF